MSTTVEPAVEPPPGNPRFPLFDGLRAVAALSVVVFHTAFYSQAYQQNAFGPLLSRLNIGVAIFFVISGFLLYRPFVAARHGGPRAPALRDYARRRVLRIVPAYWVALTILALYPGLRGMWSDWPVYFGFAQVYSPDTVLNGIAPAWTLGTEIAFYAVLPLYAWAAGRWLRDRPGAVRLELLLLGLLAVASTVVRVVAIGGHVGTLGLTLPATFAWFAVGMALAVVSTQPAAAVPRVLARAGAAWVAAGVLYVVLCYSLGRPAGYVFSERPGYAAALWEFVLSGAIAGLLALPAAFGWRAAGAPRRLLSAPAVAWLGLVSYGIYLWHNDVIVWLIDHGLLRRFSGLPFLALTVAALLIVVAIAALSYYLVERPLLRLKPGARRPRAGDPGRRAAPGAAPSAGAARGGPTGRAAP